MLCADGAGGSGLASVAPTTDQGGDLSSGGGSWGWRHGGGGLGRRDYSKGRCLLNDLDSNLGLGVRPLVSCFKQLSYLRLDTRLQIIKLHSPLFNRFHQEPPDTRSREPTMSLLLQGNGNTPCDSPQPYVVEPAQINVEVDQLFDRCLTSRIPQSLTVAPQLVIA